MTECDSAATNNESFKLCPSHNDSDGLIDEIPSLDALSFEHEHCPSRNCLCHSRKHLQNNRNCSGLTAFGVQSSRILSPNPASNTEPTTTTKDLPSSMPVGQPATNACDHVFGSGHGSCHHSVGGMQSFAQISFTVPSSTSESATTSPPMTFQHGHRGGQLLKGVVHSVQSIDLSDLQSVLPTTAEEFLPDSSCPIHRPANTVERIPACTCGQQASRLDDCTSHELAAYFDNFCYIPKNMSPMAEMMYMWNCHGMGYTFSFRLMISFMQLSWYCHNICWCLVKPKMYNILWREYFVANNADLKTAFC